MTATANVRPQIVLIVAIAENGVIGADGAIPWRLKSDMQRLKALTLNKPVVMGRKTFVSIGKPLPKRTNIVITRDKDFRAAGAVVANSSADARAIAMGDALRRGIEAVRTPVANRDGSGTRRLPGVIVLLSDGKNTSGNTRPLDVAMR